MKQNERWNRRNGGGLNTSRTMTHMSAFGRASFDSAVLIVATSRIAQVRIPTSRMAHDIR